MRIAIHRLLQTSPASFASMDTGSPVSFMTGHDDYAMMQNQCVDLIPMHATFTYPFNPGQTDVLPKVRLL